MFVVILVLVLLVFPWLAKVLPQAAQAPSPRTRRTTKPRAEQEGREKRQRGKEEAGKEKDKPSDQAKLADKGEAQGRGGQAPRRRVAAAKAAARRRSTSRGMGYAGSVDPDPANPYRMLVTLSNEGASLARVELSSERYRDLEDRSGYLGHLVMDDSDKGPGCLVQVVGRELPPPRPTCEPGDRILELNYQGKTIGIDGPRAWNCPPPDQAGRTVELVIERGKDAASRRRGDLDSPAAGSDPARAQKPEHGLDPRRDSTRSRWRQLPPSLLTTLQQVDGDKLRADEDPDAKWRTN